MKIYTYISDSVSISILYLRLTLKFSRKGGRKNKVRNIPGFIRDIIQFRRMGGNITNFDPILNEKSEQAGAASGHYFHQDLLVAQLIYDSNPARHIDIGSRIDGFIAHVATFRQIEVLDVRKLDPVGHPNISFLQANLMDSNSIEDECTDSISCLHAIEHFGLGRYGDPLDPRGHIKGFENIIRMVKPNGTIYISFPLGKSNSVEFNAHRIFHPLDIFKWSSDCGKLKLTRFDYVDDNGDLHKNASTESLKKLGSYSCGIYTFKKLPTESPSAL